ncbi:MAG: type VI secretion system protein TssA [Candidatus Krumholzibacteria bacterium]|nr:type VI secretion system protein TssA [Candidatus Krumholzibacteria bacterium]
MPDLAPLLQPLGDDRPSGPNLRLQAGDVTFSQLDELRRETDPRLDPGGEAKTADWRGVVALCEKALREKSKDLELAAALTQGLLYTEGWGGLQAGLELLAGLVDTLWETVHPGWDEGEIVAAIRARPLSWLGSSQDFLLAAKKVPLTAPIGDQPRSWFDYEQSRRVDEAAAKANRAAYQELIDAGLITGEQWRSSLAGTPLDRLETGIVELDACRSALQGLQTVCEDRFGEDAPYLLDLRNLLDDCHDYLFKYKTGQLDTSPDVHAPPVAATPAGGAAAAAAGPAGPLKSRDEAFRRLREVADFLRRTEPHSPVSALLERAVRWGNMTFEDLFRDVVQSQDARGEVGKILGLQLFDEED